MSYPIYTTEAGIDASIAHLDKRKNAEGHKVPETPDMHVSGKRVDRSKIDWSKALMQHAVLKRKHPTRKEWTFFVGDFAKRHEGKADPETGHTLDYTGAVQELPDDWNPDIIEAVIP